MNLKKEINPNIAFIIIGFLVALSLLILIPVIGPYLFIPAWAVVTLGGSLLFDQKPATATDSVDSTSSKQNTRWRQLSIFASILMSILGGLFLLFVWLDSQT